VRKYISLKGEIMRLRQRKIIETFVPPLKQEENYMEKIAGMAIAYVASLASDDDDLSADLLTKLVVAVIGEEKREVMNG